MNFKLTLLLTLGTLASAPVSAACPREFQVQPLHSGIAFDELRSIDIAKAPAQAPLVAFYGRLSGEAEGALWLHRCRDEACSPGTSAKLQSWGFFDGQPDIMLRANGRPLIANNYDNRAALFDCADAACSSGVNRPTLYAIAPLHVTAELRSDGRAVLAYFDQYARTVDMVTCEDDTCFQTTRKTVAAPPGSSVPDIKMALTSDDRPIFAITDFSGPYVDLLICDSAACESPTTRRLATHYGYSLDLSLRSDDRALVHFEPSIGPTKLVVCNDATCSMPHTQTLTGYSTSGVIAGVDDRPILKVSSLIVGFYACVTETCSDQGQFQELGTNSSGSSMAAVLGDNGEPVIAWREVAVPSVTAATCAEDDVRANGFEPALDLVPAVVVE